ASRTLVSFGVVALASTGVLAADISNSPNQNGSTTTANPSFDKNGVYSKKDQTGAAIAAGTNVDLTLNAPSKNNTTGIANSTTTGRNPNVDLGGNVVEGSGTNISFNGQREEERYFKGSGIGMENGTGFAAWGNGNVGSVVDNPNSKAEIKLEANAAGTKGNLKINGTAANAQTLYNFTLDADNVTIGDTQAINLEANNGVSSITAQKADTAKTLGNVDLDNSNLIIGKNASVEITAGTFSMGTGELGIEDPRSSKGITINGNTATFTGTQLGLGSTDIKQLRLDSANGGAKTLITLNPQGNATTATLAGVNIEKVEGNWRTTAAGAGVAGRTQALGAGTLTFNNTPTLEKTASQLLNRRISQGLDGVYGINVNGSDDLTTLGGIIAIKNNAVEANKRNVTSVAYKDAQGRIQNNTWMSSGFFDYTTSNEVKYGFEGNNIIKWQDRYTSGADALIVNNGLYVQGNQVKLGSYLVRSLVNGKWVANINNMNMLIAANQAPLTNFQNELAQGTPATILDSYGKLIDTNAAKDDIKNNAANSRLKELYTQRDAIVTTGTGITLSTLDSDQARNEADRRELVARINTLTGAAKAAAQNDLEKFDKYVALIQEARDLYNTATDKLALYDRLLTDTSTTGNGDFRYFKTYNVIQNGAVAGKASTGKLNTAGINYIADNAGVNSHRDLAVGIFDSLQESGLNELAIFNIQLDGLNNGRQWQTMTNDIHDNARSVTNFTNSVSTAINVSNDMALSDRIAKAHNPYGEKLAAAGSDAYHDFYRRTNGSVWVNAFGGANIVDGESGGVYGISLGVDKQITDSALLGIYFTYADADLKDKSAKQESDNFRLGIYSNIQLSPSWELNLHGFGQLSQTDQYTSVLGQGYTSDFDKKFFGLSGSVGKIIDFENSLFLKPFLGLNYYYSNNPGYTEKGGDYIQNVDKTQNNTISADLGLEIRKYFNETSYLFATPKVEQYLLNDGDDYTASFVGSPINFSVGASDKLKTYGQLVVGGSFGVTDNLNIDLGLGAKQILTNKVDDKNETYLSGNLGVRYKF
ncbi:autotransporter outer membrane beta-barrel domain-containing protein, partial [Helicobacter sp.]|uniref:autotransporter family protein n=1 Tax=Helicobacter sp. TaxID=218 RepID=UPI002634F7DC